jgi:hypothetical protein
LTGWLLAVFLDRTAHLLIYPSAHIPPCHAYFTGADRSYSAQIGVVGGVCLSVEPLGCYTWSLPMAEQLDKSQGRIYCSYFDNNNKEDA